MDALAVLFGGKSKLSSGLTFDEDTYRKAVPLFKEAVGHFAKAAKDVREAIRMLIVAMKNAGYEREAIEAMQPYAIRFAQDMTTEEQADEQTATDRAERPGMGEVGKGGSETNQGGRKPGGAKRDRNPADDGVVEGEPPADVAPPAWKDAGVPAGDRAAKRVQKRDGSLDTGGDATTGRAGVSDGGMAAGRTGGRSGGTRSDGGITDDAPIISYPNYEIADPKALIGGTPKRRFEKNRKAIETYLDLKESGLQPTKEQLDAMAAYIGWGSFGQELFHGSWEHKRPKQGWETEDDWLREHFGKDAWESAQASILNAHYTDPPTVSAIWKIAQKLGFRGGDHRNTSRSSVGEFSSMCE